MGARKEEYTAETVIFKENDICKKMFIILDGQVVLYKNYKKEDEYIIGACNKGKTFGEMNLFTDSPCIYTAVALTDVTVAWFEKSNLDSFITGYPTQTMQLLEQIAKSYNLLGKNLQMAIAEIGELKEIITNNGIASKMDKNNSYILASKYEILPTFSEIITENNSDKDKGGFHYIDPSNPI